jgi:hypothetical protein
MQLAAINSHVGLDTFFQSFVRCESSFVRHLESLIFQSLFRNLMLMQTADDIIENLKGLSMYNAGSSHDDDHAVKVQTSPDGKYSGALTAETDQNVYRPNVS